MTLSHNLGGDFGGLLESAQKHPLRSWVPVLGLARGIHPHHSHLAEGARTQGLCCPQPSTATGQIDTKSLQPQKLSCSIVTLWVLREERMGVGNGSGCQHRLDILNPGQSDRYLCFPRAWSFCNGLGVGLDVCDSLLKLLLQEFFFFGVAFRKH